MQKQTSLSSSEGFTLIEVMTAMLILTVGLLGLLQAVNISMEHNVKNRLRDTAVMIGEQQVNSIMKMSFDAPIINAYTTVNATSGAISKSFNVQRTKEGLTTRIPEDSYRIRVNVRWSFKNVTSNHEVIAVTSR